ncbi:hypothetical protein PtB15_11B98 [Puccinia triticina]|nr:hypothetical protein PtB15_11B98 [Puccinia triticina]
MDALPAGMSIEIQKARTQNASSTRAGLRPRQILPSPQSQLLLEKVEALVMDAFTGAAERRIEVSDCLEIFVIEAGKGVRVIRNELKTN